MPNQPKTRAFAFRLPPEYVAAIDAEVAERGTDRTEVVRRALREHFAMPESVEDGGDDE